MKLYNALRNLGYGPAAAYKKAQQPRGNQAWATSILPQSRQLNATFKAASRITMRLAMKSQKRAKETPSILATARSSTTSKLWQKPKRIPSNPSPMLAHSYCAVFGETTSATQKSLKFLGLRGQNRHKTWRFHIKNSIKRPKTPVNKFTIILIAEKL